MNFHPKFGGKSDFQSLIDYLSTKTSFSFWHIFFCFPHTVMKYSNILRCPVIAANLNIPFPWMIKRFLDRKWNYQTDHFIFSWVHISIGYFNVLIPKVTQCLLLHSHNRINRETVIRKCSKFYNVVRRCFLSCQCFQLSFTVKEHFVFSLDIGRTFWSSFLLNS